MSTYSANNGQQFGSFLALRLKLSQVAQTPKYKTGNHKILGEKLGKNLYNLELGKCILNIIQKSRIRKRKIW